MDIKKIISFLLSLSILISMFNVNILSDGDTFSVTAETTIIPKIPKITEDEFVHGEILVGLNERYLGETPEKLFPELDIVKIKDRYKSKYERAKDNPNAIPEVVEDFKNSIGTSYKITIADKTREGVISSIEKLRHNPYIRHAVPNYISYPASTQLPNDPRYNELWGMNRIRAHDAWSITTGSATVMVGVLDTGIDHTHPDLVNNVDMTRSYNAYTDTYYDTMDYNSHGTHVAGTIGAQGDNGIGVTGVNWNVKMVPIKISDNSGISPMEIRSDAVDYAREIGLPIINMSYHIGYSPELIDSVSKYNGLFVICAGNLKNDIDNNIAYISLTAFSNVIFVGSIDTNDNSSEWDDPLWRGSNYGSNTVHLYAPGDDILSACACYANACGSTAQNPYCYKTGTSMAAPHVAGVAALIKTLYPNATGAQLKQAILLSVDKLPQLSDKCITGGRLNAFWALHEVRNSITIKGVSYSTSLITLNLSGLNLTNSDIQQLKYMANLVYLYLDGNQISDLTSISGLVRLRCIISDNNQISDLTPLKGLTELTFLALDENQISNLWPLAWLTKLKYLYLASNQINDLHPLNALDYLEVLNLWDNQITDSSVSWLCHMSTLKWLFLGGNNITNPMPLTALRGNLEWLDLCVNPISLTIITQLRAALPNCAIYF